ncbi:MFS transporter [Candidatus Bathyarchaeota archaeon]|nr:MFS transporter [Candidatus Bathyarchaeota archaeon]
MGFKDRLDYFRDFLARQSHNYRMMIVRSGGANFLFNLTGNYSSIFTKALGADNMTIGYMSSASAFISMIISMPVGWVTDNHNLKRVMGAGMFLNIVMIGLYAFAQDWRWILVAMIVNPFTMALMFRSQQVIVTNGLKTEDRATGMGFRMIIAQVLGLVSPIPAALLVNYFGGLNVDGIRPLFYIRLVGLIIVYAYVYVKLTDTIPQMRGGDRVGFLGEMAEVMKGGARLRTMILVGALGAFVWSTMESFVFLYAAEVKGADELILGLMTTVTTVSAIIFSIPLNRIADTRGRKFAFISVRPALWLSFVIVVLADHPYWLLVSWFLRGIALSTSAYNTLMMEMVPPEQRGRWLGISNTFSALVRIGAPILGGFLYNSSHPSLIFLIPLAVDMLLRIPILHFMVPETLKAGETVRVG